MISIKRKAKLSSSWYCWQKYGFQQWAHIWYV